MITSDTLPFLRAWLKAPLRVASVTPSGSALAALITSGIRAGNRPVLELGPGTGAFTTGLLKRGVAERDITLVELDPSFALLLQRRFPQARMLQVDAASLVRSSHVEARSHQAAISGLPLLSMKTDTVAAILEGVFSALSSDGALYQFTYGARCPVPKTVMDRLGLSSARVGFVWANLPPATVYRIEIRRT